MGNKKKCWGARNASRANKELTFFNSNWLCLPCLSLQFLRSSIAFLCHVTNQLQTVWLESSLSGYSCWWKQSRLFCHANVEWPSSSRQVYIKALLSVCFRNKNFILMWMSMSAFSWLQKPFYGSYTPAFSSFSFVRPLVLWAVGEQRGTVLVFLLPGISRQQTIFLNDLRCSINLWLQRCAVSGLLKKVLSCRACFSLSSNQPFCLALL